LHVENDRFILALVVQSNVLAEMVGT